MTHRAEVVSTVLLAVAAVATAWSGESLARDQATHESEDARLADVTIALGCIVFLGALIWIATAPVSIAI